MIKAVLIILTGSVFLISCTNAFNTDEYIIPDETVRISDQSFTRPVLIYGEEYDGLIVDGCTFTGITGSGITIRNADNVTVQNCSFSEIKGTGVNLEGVIRPVAIQSRTIPSRIYGETE